jgi:two-component system sensor histidine kinase PhoQ
MASKYSYSLRQRMLFSASLVLVLFISLTVLILDQAFNRGLQVDLQDRLKTQLYLVLGAAEFEQGQLSLPQSLNFPKLNQLNSGSLALILDDQEEFVWRSSSSESYAKGIITNSLTSQTGLQAPGQQGQGSLEIDGQSFFYTSLGVAWELPSGSLKNYTLFIAEHSSRFDQSISQYRIVVWFGLGALAVLLLVVFSLTLNWGLSPLEQLALDLNLIETGTSTQLIGNYPKELTVVTENLNQLLQHQQRQHTRYRNTLSNLAHSLKTPLAVLRGLVDKHNLVEASVRVESAQIEAFHINTLTQQVTRMDEIVQHQLQRASHTGPQLVQVTFEVLPLLESLATVIEKVYEETLQCIDIDTEDDVVFKGARGDLMEIIGNLLDNAAKYGGGLIRLALSNEQEHQQEKKHDRIRCRILVEDNGQGIAEQDIADILRRGVRADQKQQGQGIGLAMVVDIVDQYQGKLHLSQSSLGGLKVEILI